MANFAPIRTLVEAIRTTGWWPSDVPSSLDGKTRREVVALDAVAFVDFNPSAWEIISPTPSDSKSLPVPFTRRELCFIAAPPRQASRWPWQKQKTLEPPHVYVLVADAADPKDINPISDCCALVPFDERNRDLDPAGRIELAKHAIAVCLNARGAWPYKHPISVAEAATRHVGGDSRAIVLERGKDVACNPNEWAEPVRGEAVGYPPIRTIWMEHKPTEITFPLYIYGDKLNPPLVLNPYTDCAVITSRAALLKASESQKAEGRTVPPVPPDHIIDELGRAAIVALFTSIGAWAAYAKPDGPSITSHPFVKGWQKDSSVITLTPGREILFDPDEWNATTAIKGEPPFQTVLMRHKPSGMGLVVVIYVDKVNTPSTIDPLVDCCFVFSRSYLQERYEAFTKRGFNPRPLPSDDAIKALGREAIAAFLSGLGVTGPFRQKSPDDLPALADLQSAIDAFLFMLDERKPHWPPVVIEDLEMSSRTHDLRSLLARLEAGEIDPQAEMRFAALIGLMRDLEKMDSLDETGWQQAEIRSSVRVLMPRLRRLVFGDATPEEHNQVRGTVYPLRIEAQELLRCGFGDDFDFGSIGNAEQLAWLRKLLDTFPPHEDDRKWLVGPDQGANLPSDDEDEDGMASAAAQS